MAVTGMKLDIRNRGGIYRTVWQTPAEAVALFAALARLVVLAGLAGWISGAWADDLASLADPTQPAYSVSAATGMAVARPMGPMLQSTFISASQRRAVIGGKSYAVGDKFGGGTITDIQPYEVVLKHSARETRLRLLPKLAKETYMVKVPQIAGKKGKNEMYR